MVSYAVEIGLSNLHLIELEDYGPMVSLPSMLTRWSLTRENIYNCIQLTEYEERLLAPQ